MAGVKCVVEVDTGQNCKDKCLQRSDQNSSAVSATIMIMGSGVSATQPPAAMSMTMKPAKTLSAIWPASMFANRRIERLIGREMKDYHLDWDDERQKHGGYAGGHKQPEEMRTMLGDAVD